ncbi:MAG TPA: hypothetical protein VL201_02545 [Patescibacteria group bacterium]|jgi:hypothetical protein|nr:hypothetical protein [Patescibacteria group bacterium]
MLLPIENKKRQKIRTFNCWFFSRIMFILPLIFQLCVASFNNGLSSPLEVLLVLLNMMANTYLYTYLENATLDFLALKIAFQVIKNWPFIPK